MTPGAAEGWCMKMVDRQLSRIRKGHLAVHLPDGTTTDYGDDSEPVHLNIHNYRFYTRLVAGGNIGLGEAWTDRDWDTENLTGVLELFIEAYYISGSEKRNKLQKANVELEKLRYYVRLCYELGFYNSTKYHSVLEKIQEIGRMNGGWIKSLR